MTLNKRGGVAKWGEIISAEFCEDLTIQHCMRQEYCSFFSGTKNRVAQG